MLLSRLLSSFSYPWVHSDTVSRQILGDIQETQFSGSKMEVHVHLKNAFPGGIGNQRIITFGYKLWFAFHPSPRDTEEFEFFDLVDFGDVAFSVESVISLYLYISVSRL